MTAAVFGGAFDPPHLGHVALVRAALEHFGFKRLLVVPAGDPPHKDVATPAEIRVRLAELAFAGFPQVEISLLELAPSGPRYTVDTLDRLRERYDDLTLLVGADQFAGFLSWREPDRLLELATLAVANRPGYPDAESQRVLAALERPERVSFFQIPAHSVSSQEIRDRAHDRQPIDDLVPRPVAVEIDRLGLYRD